MARGAWQATVYGVAKRRTRLKQLSMQTPMHVEPRALGLRVAPLSRSPQTSSESWMREKCVAVGV